MLQRLLALPVLLPPCCWAAVAGRGGLFKSDKTEYKARARRQNPTVPTLEGAAAT